MNFASSSLARTSRMLHPEVDGPFTILCGALMEIYYSSEIVVPVKRRWWVLSDCFDARIPEERGRNCFVCRWSGIPINSCSGFSCAEYGNYFNEPLGDRWYLYLFPSPSKFLTTSIRIIKSQLCIHKCIFPGLFFKSIFSFFLPSVLTE